MGALGSAGTGYDWWDDARALPYHDALSIGAANSGGTVTPQELANQIGAESSFDPGALNTRSGATGIAQILPTTAARPGWGIAPVDPTDPVAAIEFAGSYDGARGVSGYSHGGYTADQLKTIRAAAGDDSTAGVVISHGTATTIKDGSIVTGDGSSYGTAGKILAHATGSRNAGSLTDLIGQYWMRFIVGLVGLLLIGGGLLMFRPVQNTLATVAQVIPK